MGRRNRNQSRRPRDTGGQWFEEVFTFSVAIGKSLSLTIANTLSSLPPNRSFKITSIEVEACPDVIPSAVSVSVTEATQITNTSGTLVLGSIPRRVTVRAPRSQDWVYHTPHDAWQYGIVDAVCLGTRTGSIRGVIKVRVLLHPELLAPTCPSRHLTVDADGTCGQRVYDLVSSASGSSFECASGGSIRRNSVI